MTNEKILDEYNSRTIQDVMMELEMAAMQEPDKKYILLYPEELETIVQQKDKELIEKIKKIELAPDKKTIQKIMELENKAEAFGYCQGWMIDKIIGLIKNQ